MKITTFNIKGALDLDFNNKGIEPDQYCSQSYAQIVSALLHTGADQIDFKIDAIGLISINGIKMSNSTNHFSNLIACFKSDNQIFLPVEVFESFLCPIKSVLNEEKSHFTFTKKNNSTVCLPVLAMQTPNDPDTEFFYSSLEDFKKVHTSFTWEEKDGDLILHFKK